MTRRDFSQAKVIRLSPQPEWFALLVAAEHTIQLPARNTASHSKRDVPY